MAFAGKSQEVAGFAKPAMFEIAFLDNPQAADSSIFGNFKKIRLGSLKIESGSLVVSDPVQMHHAPVIPYSFPKGSFPVEITAFYTDSIELDSLSYISYSRVVFSNKAVAKWVLLVDAAKDSLFRKRSNYATWSESAVLLDENARQAIIRKPHNEWAGLFIDQLNDGVQYNKWGLYGVGKYNMLAYSGFDYTRFRVYLGLDAEGRIARLLVDGAMFHLPSSAY